MQYLTWTAQQPATAGRKQCGERPREQRKKLVCGGRQGKDWGKYTPVHPPFGTERPRLMRLRLQAPTSTEYRATAPLPRELQACRGRCPRRVTRHHGLKKGGTGGQNGHWQRAAGGYVGRAGCCQREPSALLSPLYCTPGWEDATPICPSMGNQQQPRNGVSGAGFCHFNKSWMAAPISSSLVLPCWLAASCTAGPYRWPAGRLDGCPAGTSKSFYPPNIVGTFARSAVCTVKAGRLAALLFCWQSTL